MKIEIKGINQKEKVSKQERMLLMGLVFAAITVVAFYASWFFIL